MGKEMTDDEERELIINLRKYASVLRNGPFAPMNCVPESMENAADAIEAKMSELEQVKAERDITIKILSEAVDCPDDKYGEFNCDDSDNCKNCRKIGTVEGNTDFSINHPPPAIDKPYGHNLNLLVDLAAKLGLNYKIEKKSLGKGIIIAEAWDSEETLPSWMGPDGNADFVYIEMKDYPTPHDAECVALGSAIVESVEKK